MGGILSLAGAFHIFKRRDAALARSSHMYVCSAAVVNPLAKVHSLVVGGAMTGGGWAAAGGQEWNRSGRH